VDGSLKMSNDNKKISLAVVRRLPRYYRYLYDLLQSGVTRISSRELSEKMGVTASQIRQDLNCFGGFGQQGYGYNVQNLFNEISKILGTDHRFNVIIIGLGNMGHALANYENFKKRGFDIIGIFDIKPELIGTTVNNIKVMHMDELDEFVKNNRVDIGILSVPYGQTPCRADRHGKSVCHILLLTAFQFRSSEVQICLPN
jgi:redox-sensing transcriptional repressor